MFGIKQFLITPFGNNTVLIYTVVFEMAFEVAHISLLKSTLLKKNNNFFKYTEWIYILNSRSTECYHLKRNLFPLQEIKSKSFENHFLEILLW